MKKVAIVGVEGSGKTVMLAGLGELYSHVDANGFFLDPKDYGTASYVADKIERMRKGEWPAATAGDAQQGLDWTLRRKTTEDSRPDDVCEVSFLDFAGEVYRLAFGVRKNGELSGEAETLRQYVKSADEVIVLINLRDIIANGLSDSRVRESMWITNAILKFAMDTKYRSKAPRAAIVLSQADSYADTIASCGGAKGVLEKHLPHVANAYGWLDVLAANAVDRTRLDDEGNVVPSPDFTTSGLQGIMDWIIAGTAPVEIGPEEMYRQGMDYLDGNGVPQSNEKAFRRILTAAENGHAGAQNELGYMYDVGRGVSKSLVEAAKWYRKAAEIGNAQAQYNIGSMYDRGEGVPQSYAEAEKWYQLAANQGHKKAIDALVDLRRMLAEAQAQPPAVERQTVAPQKAGPSGGTILFSIELTILVSLGLGVLCFGHWIIAFLLGSSCACIVKSWVQNRYNVFGMHEWRRILCCGLAVAAAVCGLMDLLWWATGLFSASYIITQPDWEE